MMELANTSRVKTTEDASNILKRMNIDNPTEQQKKEAEKIAIKEHQIIVFAYRSRQILKIN